MEVRIGGIGDDPGRPDHLFLLRPVIIGTVYTETYLAVRWDHAHFFQALQGDGAFHDIGVFAGMCSQFQPFKVPVEIELATEIDFTNGALITGVTETDWPEAWLARTIIFKS